MPAQQCDLEVDEFIWTGGDCHLYSNHVEQAREQLARTPGPLPRLEILRRPDAIDAYDYEDFRLVGYEAQAHRSEEHTSELQSLMRISYAVFCLKKKKQKPLSTTKLKSNTTTRYKETEQNVT